MASRPQLFERIREVLDSLRERDIDRGVARFPGRTMIKTPVDFHPGFVGPLGLCLSDQSVRAGSRQFMKDSMVGGANARRRSACRGFLRPLAEQRLFAEAIDPFANVMSGMRFHRANYRKHSVEFFIHDILHVACEAEESA